MNLCQKSPKIIGASTHTLKTMVTVAPTAPILTRALKNTHLPTCGNFKLKSLTYLLLISKLVTESLLSILDFEADEAACGTDETEAGGEVVAGCSLNEGQLVVSGLPVV